MNKIQTTIIEVYADWVGLAKPSLMGILYASLHVVKKYFHLNIAEIGLKVINAHALDPSLQLFQGTQYAPKEQENFGVFLDSSPDRWGRFLMNRREAYLAREEKRKERKLLRI